MARSNFYGNNYVPHAFYDGNDMGSDQNTWRNRILNEMAVSAPLIMNIGGEYDSVSRTGTAIVTITAVDTVGSRNTNLKLRIAITESNLYWRAPNGTNWHHQTFRDLTPNSSGLSVTISQGQTIQFIQTYSAPSPLVQENCEVVAWVQSNTTKKVLQAAKSDLLALTYHLDGFSLISPADSADVYSQNPNFVWHASADVDSGFPISYQVYVSTSQYFTNAIISDPITDTSWTCTTALSDDSTYFWKVVASNGHAPFRPSNEVFRFSVEGYGLTDFDLISPDGDTLPTCYPVLLWHSSRDPDSGFAVSYTAYISMAPDFSNPITSELCSDSTWTCPLCLPNDTSYFWKIVATNGHAPDKESNQVYQFRIHELGPCQYVVGDVNNNTIFNGIDVTYSVGFFKGGNPPPYSCECPAGNSWFVAGDVNGNCNFNGIDVTYMVAYFKGGSAPIPCPDCPPGR